MDQNDMSLTPQELDEILEDYFDGALDPDQDQQLSEYVIEVLEAGEGWDFSGLVISEDLIPDYDPDWGLTEYLGEARSGELENGAAPTEDELELFRAAWLHWAAHTGEADADVIPGFTGTQLTHSDGRSCYGVVLTLGYSFTQIKREFHGLFSDQDAVLHHLRSLGHVDRDVAEPASDLIERARASSQHKDIRPANPHPIDALDPAEFEAQYLRSSRQWDRLTHRQMERLLRRSLLHYGLANDTSLIGAMATLMRRAVRDLVPENRARVYRDVCETIIRNKWSAFYALIPVVVHESAAEIVATATIDFISLSPVMDDGRPAAFCEAVALIQDGVPNSQGGVFGGIVSLGDERFTPELKALRKWLVARDVQAAARCDTGWPSDAQIRFWLDWAEELMPTAGREETDSVIGSIGSALVRIRKRAVTSTVIRAEKPFPAHQLESSLKILESWDLDQYARLIADRLYALEAHEPPPKVFSAVLEVWGLSPRAAEHDRVPLSVIR
jgi:hypothetical protein